MRSGAVSMLAMLVACGPSLGPDDDGGTHAAGDGRVGGTCSSLGETPAMLPQVHTRLVTGPPLAPRGGVIANGHYVLTEAVQYSAQGPATDPMAIAAEALVATNTLQFAFWNGADVFQYGARIAPVGTTLNGAVTCSSGNDAFGVTTDHVTGYDGAPASLTLHVTTTAGATVLLTLSRQ